MRYLILFALALVLLYACQPKIAKIYEERELSYATYKAKGRGLPPQITFDFKEGVYYYYGPMCGPSYFSFLNDTTIQLQDHLVERDKLRRLGFLSSNISTNKVLKEKYPNDIFFDINTIRIDCDYSHGFEENPYALVILELADKSCLGRKMQILSVSVDSSFTEKITARKEMYRQDWRYYGKVSVPITKSKISKMYLLPVSQETYLYGDPPIYERPNGSIYTRKEIYKILDSSQWVVMRPIAEQKWKLGINPIRWATIKNKNLIKAEALGFSAYCTNSCRLSMEDFDTIHLSKDRLYIAEYERCRLYKIDDNIKLKSFYVAETEFRTLLKKMVQP
jgi:hypothetical protein